jgi:hypothetical protein
LGAQKNSLNIIEVINIQKNSFRPSKWPHKFRNRKTVENSKLPEDYFELVGIGGWPPISTWINELSPLKPKFNPNYNIIHLWK